MEALPILMIIIGIVSLFLLVRRLRSAPEPQTRPETPLDPEIDEVFHRPDASGRRLRKAEDAVRAATPHVQRAMAEIGSRPLLVVYSDEIVQSGVLVVTTDQTLVFREGRLLRADHRPATTTSIMTVGGAHPLVEIEDRGMQIRYYCASLETARLICGVIDTWAENPHVRADPRVVITPRRVHIPDEFFADTLRASGHHITPYNLRSVHERFGMQFINKARQYIDSKHGVAAGERFTTMYGRPERDEMLPSWPTRVLDGWREIDSGAAHVFAFLPHFIREFLLETGRENNGYLSRPELPLSMWMSDQYEDGGRGARRYATGWGQPPVRA